ncbi:MAG: AAA family ATPase [Sphaerochaeta sp.]
MDHLIITIRREFGAEGHEIGSQLSRRLAIDFYDKDILGKAVLKKGQDETSFKAVDENITPNNVNLRFPSFAFTRKSDQLFELEKEVIRDIAESKSCIIMGRLSDYILRDKKNTLNVYITAPMEFRVKNIQDKYNYSETESKKMVRRMDIMRRDYRNYYSNGKTKLFDNKDLVLNRKTFGIEGCVDILEIAVHSKLSQLQNL